MNAIYFLSLEPSKMEIYRLLSDCYLLPDRDLKEKVNRLHKDMGSVCSQASPFVKCMMEAMDGMECTENLKVEYARLFIGPFELPAPPYGSVYLESERRVMGNSTLHALQMYREAGLSLAENFKDAPDHIAAELEFVYFLICKEIEKTNESDADGVLFYLEKRKAFLENHLGLWAFDFVKDIEKNSETPVYKNLARATGAFLRSDLGALIGLTLDGVISGN